MAKIIVCASCGEEKPHHAKGLCRGCYKHCWYQEHRQEQLARVHRWQKENYEKCVSYMRHYKPPTIVCMECGGKRTHRGKGLCDSCYGHNWYEKNRAKHSASMQRCRKNNPEAGRLHLARYRARKSNVANTLTQEQIDFEMNIARAMWPDEKLHIHHIVPISKGGGHTWGNIMIIPATLNLSIQDRLPEEIYGQSELTSWAE